MDLSVHGENSSFARSSQITAPIASAQGNLLKGILIWFVRRKGIEPIKRVSSSFFITKWFKIAVFIYKKN